MEEQWLIDLIQAATGYTVTFSEEDNVNLIHGNISTPKVFVGHTEIKLQYPESFFADLYKELDNQELLLTQVQLLCKRTDFLTARTAIKNAYQGESPFPLDGNYSSLGFAGGKVIAATSNKIWYSELVGLIMPRVS